MSKFFKIAGIATLVAVIGAGALGMAVYAQEPDPGTPFGKMAGYFEQVRDLVAGKLGVERAALDAAEKEARAEVIGLAVEDGVITQDQADAMLSHLEDGFGPGSMGFGRGRMGHSGGPRRGRMGSMGNMVNILAEQLGMTADELIAELQADKTVAELAETRGVELQTLVDAVIADRAESLNQAVAEGRITQEQADGMLSHMEEELAEHLTEPRPWDADHGSGECFGEPGNFAPRRGGNKGGFRGFPGQTVP